MKQDVKNISCNDLFINEPIEIKIDNIKTTNDIVFVYYLEKPSDVIKNYTHDEILKKYGITSLDLFKNKEKLIRKKMNNHDKNRSFIIAGVAGLNGQYSDSKIFDSEYYTSYFELSAFEIDLCGFCIENDFENIELGIKGLTNVLKKYKEINNNDLIYNIGNNKILNKPQYNGINIIVPFDVNIISILPPVNKRNYYYASLKKIDSINKSSDVCLSKKDAIKRALIKDKKDLFFVENIQSKYNCKPPEDLVFKNKPDDVPIFIYTIKCDMYNSICTNYYFHYTWNRRIIKKINTKNCKVEKINQWKNYI